MSESYRGFTIPTQGDDAPWGADYTDNTKAVIDAALNGPLENYKSYGYVIPHTNGGAAFLCAGMSLTQNSSMDPSETYGSDYPAIVFQNPDGGSTFGHAAELVANPFTRTIISTAGPGFDIYFEFNESSTTATRTVLMSLSRRPSTPLGGELGNPALGKMSDWGAYACIGVGWDEDNPTIGIYTNAADSGSLSRLGGVSVARTTDRLRVRLVCEAGSKDVGVIVTNVDTGAELINRTVLEVEGVPVDLRLGVAVNTTQGSSGVQEPVYLYKIIKKILY